MVFKTDAVLDKMNASRLLMYYRSIRFVLYDEAHNERECAKYIQHVKLVLDSKSHVERKKNFDK